LSAFSFRGASETSTDMLAAVKAPVFWSVVAGRLFASATSGVTAAGAAVDADAWAPANAPVSAIVASPSTAAPLALSGRWSNRMPNLLVTKVIHGYTATADRIDTHQDDC
jgi:hypothetical protein